MRNTREIFAIFRIVLHLEVFKLLMRYFCKKFFDSGKNFTGYCNEFAHKSYNFRRTDVWKKSSHKYSFFNCENISRNLRPKTDFFGRFSKKFSRNGFSEIYEFSKIR